MPSTISSRWYSSMAAKIWKTSRPVGVVVSMSCLSTTRSMPRSRRSSTSSHHVLHAAHGPAHPGDHEDVTRAEVGERLIQLGPRGVLAADAVVDEQLVDAVSVQLVDLAVVALALGATPGRIRSCSLPLLCPVLANTSNSLRKG